MIELTSAGVDFGGRQILSNLSIDIQPGSFHFLTGPSGAGKSSFLKLCSGALMPSAGLVQVFGRDTRGLERDEIAAMRRRIGFVQQESDFLDHLTITENVLLPVRLSKRSNAAGLEDAKDLMNWVGLSEVADAYPYEVSGGEKARAALARAVITDPEIILADEPTGKVDWDMSQKLIQLMVQLNKMGKTFVIATHDIAMIRSVKPLTRTRVLRIKDKTLEIAGADL
ncbi:MAG: ATP-binding cassette domain-containing protein [Pseudomonadota bacterium]